MWRNDIRLRGLTDLINEAHLRKYEDAVAEHPYTGLSAVIDWLTLQVAEVLLWRASAPPRAAISSILADGDGHYAEVFSRLKLLSTERDESLPVEPLSYSVDKILEALKGRRMGGEEVSTVYGYLEEALLSGMAIRLASDNRFYGYEHWLSLTERFRQSRSFYGGLLNHIPEPAIQEHAAELAAPYDPDNVVRYLSQADKRMEAEAYQLDYLKRQEDYKDKSPALYIDQLTKGADLMNLSEREELKKHLLALTGRTAELKWLDALRWPLAQAAALNSYRNVDELEALIAELVIQREQLQSPFVHLLLIILDRYFEVMRQISFNLRQFGQPLGHHYMEPAIAQKLHSEGAARLLQWKTSDIQHSLSRVFDNLRLIAAPKEAFHRGLFGWVAAQDRERWLENAHAELILLMIDELHTQYLAAFKPGGWLKGDLLRGVAPDALSWRSFKLLYSLWQTDESDSDLRQALREQMTGFVESADFSWNNAYAFDNDHLRQALHFTNLFIDSYPNFGTLQALTSLHRVWHEGWAYSGAAGIKNTNRYIFLLTCGMCLALLKYEKPDQSEATELWQNYLDETAAQYRSSVSEMDRTHYLLPLRLQLHILLKYDAAALPAAVTRIFELIDYTEDRIVLAHSLMESSQHLGKPVSNAVRAGVWMLLENGYWPLALRIGHAPVTQSIRQYETMYNAVKVWYQAP